MKAIENVVSILNISLWLKRGRKKYAYEQLRETEHAAVAWKKEMGPKR